LEAAVGSAVGEEGVVVADDFLAFYGVAVSFLAVGVEEGFGVGEGYGGVFSAADA